MNTPPPLESTQQSSNYEERPSEFLKRVRGQTCYGMLRKAIDYLLWISIAAIVLYEIDEIYRTGVTPFVVFFAIVQIVILIVLAIGIKQLLASIVDMADIRIEQSRKKAR